MWARKVDGAVNTNVKAAGEDKLLASMAAAGCGEQDLILLAGGKPDDASKLLGAFRLSLAKKENLIPADRFEFAWIVDFPMFDWDAEDKRWVAMHHPFTAPLDEDRAMLDGDPSKARAKAYDLVLNGSEIGGGSIRIHDSAMQSRIFQLLNISDEDAKLRFGFFVDALQYGTPPHGGIALGLDRMVAHPGGRELDPRGDRVSEDGRRRRPDDRRAVGRRPEAARRAEAAPGGRNRRRRETCAGSG